MSTEFGDLDQETDEGLGLARLWSVGDHVLGQKHHRGNT